MAKLTTRQVPDGQAGNRATAYEMLRLMRWGSSHPAVRQLAAQLTTGEPIADVLALQAYVRDSIRYQYDDDAAARAGVPESGEFLRSPEITLRDRSGDCDCQATLLGALILARHPHAPLAVVMAWGDRFRSDASHTLLALYDRESGALFPLETIIPGMPAGEWPGELYQLEVFPLEARGVGFSWGGFKPVDWVKSAYDATKRAWDNARAEAARFAQRLERETLRIADQIEAQTKRSADDVLGELQSVGVFLEQQADGAVKFVETIIPPGGIPFNRVIAGVADVGKALAEGAKRVAERAGDIGQNVIDEGKRAVDNVSDEAKRAAERAWSAVSRIGGDVWRELERAQEKFVEIKWGEGAFGLPKFEFNKRIGFVLGSGLNPFAIVLASSKYFDPVFKEMKRVNAQIGDEIGYYPMPTTWANYFANVDFASKLPIVPPGVREAMQAAVLAYQLAATADDVYQQREAFKKLKPLLEEMKRLEALLAQLDAADAQLQLQAAREAAEALDAIGEANAPDLLTDKKTLGLGRDQLAMIATAEGRETLGANDEGSSPALPIALAALGIGIGGIAYWRLRR